MADDETPEPMIAIDAGPPSFSVVCPICETVKDFDFDEMDEADCGNWWSVADQYRFDFCQDCQTLIDYGQVAYQLHTPKPSR